MPGRPCPQRRRASHAACCICRTSAPTRGWLAKVASIVITGCWCCLENRPDRRTQTLSHYYCVLPNLKVPHHSSITQPLSLCCISYLADLKLPSAYSIQSIWPQTTECYGPRVLVIFLVLSLVTSCLAPAPESLVGETTLLCWRSSTCSCGRLARKREGQPELTLLQTRLAVRGVLRRALGIARCRAQGQVGAEQP